MVIFRLARKNVKILSLVGLGWASLVIISTRQNDLNDDTINYDMYIYICITIERDVWYSSCDLI